MSLTFYSTRFPRYNDVSKSVHDSSHRWYDTFPHLVVKSKKMNRHWALTAINWWPVMTDMLFCGRPRKPRPLICCLTLHLFVYVDCKSSI